MLRLALMVILAASAFAELGFKRVMDTPYPKNSGTSSGDMAIGDINGDGKKDVIVIGNMKAKPVILVYMQKAAGSFALAEDTKLPGVDVGCIRLADMDRDGDLDVVLYGKTAPAAESAIFHVYKNDGGVFSLLADLGKDLPSEDFEDVPGAWGKSGGANDNRSDEGVHGLYNANGWSKGVLELADLDGDGDIDIVFAGTKGLESGTDPAGQMIQRDWETSGVFLNNGGTFSYLTGAGFPLAGIPSDPETMPARSYPGMAKVSRGAAAIGDFNRDGKPDLALIGQANMGPKANAGIPETQRNGKPIAEVYLGKGDGTFTLVTGHGLTGLIDGTMTVVDVNKDGKPDIAVIGSTGHPKDANGGRFTRIYLGTGDGTFTEDAQVYQTPKGDAASVAPVMTGDIAFGDLDNDGDLDMVIGGNASDRALFIYINDGGKFSIVDLSKMKQGIGSSDAKMMSESDASAECDIAIVDIDGDGDNDIIVNGRGGSNQLLVFANKLK